MPLSALQRSFSFSSIIVKQQETRGLIKEVITAIPSTPPHAVPARRRAARPSTYRSADARERQQMRRIRHVSGERRAERERERLNSQHTTKNSQDSENNTCEKWPTEKISVRDTVSPVTHTDVF